ncbi:hypothetical protein [Xylocopilactobacillus apis]|nr:hypothetical protein [Xylocopilactobacillus apis]
MYPAVVVSSNDYNKATGFVMLHQLRLKLDLIPFMLIFYVSKN